MRSRAVFLPRVLLLDGALTAGVRDLGDAALEIGQFAGCGGQVDGQLRGLLR
jgi:hypothetical protein